MSSGNCPSLSIELEEAPFSELLRLSPADSLMKLTTTVMSSICRANDTSNQFQSAAAGCAQRVHAGLAQKSLQEMQCVLLAAGGGTVFMQCVH